MDIEDAHPLQMKAYLDDIWPCLKLLKCGRERGPDFRVVLKTCFHKELGIEVSRTGYARTIEEEKEINQTLKRKKRVDSKKKKTT